MYKKLRAYTKYIEEASANPTPELAAQHRAILAQFQHERLVHLIVTLFFALFMILFFGLYCILAACGNSAWGSPLNMCVGAVAVLLLITTVCYAIHYYHLENGVQKLEEITKKLYK